MTRIKRIGVWQTAKVAAVIYFIIAAIILIPLGLITMLFGIDAGFPGLPVGFGLFYLVLPFIYAVLIFFLTAVACAFYNMISNWIGGIEIELEQDAIEGEY